MTTPLRTLILEDHPEEAELIQRELRRGGITGEAQVVATEQEFSAALGQRWDVILADYRLPGFGALAALRILRERQVDTPFIVVTGTLGDEAAADCIKQGAADFLLKDRLARLVPAIQQIMADRALRAEKMQAEAELRKMEKRLGDLFERMRMVPYTWSWREKRFREVGPHAEALLGYPMADWLQPEFRSRCLHRDDWQRIRGFVDRTAKRGDVYEMEYRLMGRDGRMVWVRDIAGFEGAPEDQMAHGFLYDITDAKRRDQQLLQAQKMEAIGQLTGGMAHDFNNLLGIVIGSLDLVQEELPRDHTAQQLLQTAMDACLRGAQLNRSLLAFSRQQDLQPVRVDVAAIVGEIGKMLRRVIGERIELEIIAGADIWPIVVDPSQLESALLNLAVNARDAMPDGGRLALETSNTVVDATYAAENADIVAGEYVMIAISDTGSGMTPDVLTRVFEPFFTTKEVGKGTGLGLAMVHGFVKQSRGHVKIYSEPGRGTTIRLYLPRDRRATLRTDNNTEAVERPARGGGETVLVVEDNQPLRRVAAIKISKLGYRVIEAASASAALHVLDSGAHPDLLFTDVVMPGALDGVGLAREAVKRVPGLKVLLTSGFSDRNAIRNEADQPLWPLLSKPYRTAELALALSKALK